jgi:hypothetical protein
MTHRKHFKQLVRARMEKTGERYAAARRHVIGSPDGDTNHSFHFPGSIPAVTAMRALLAAADVKDPATGQPFTEEILFGLAGGIGIGVFTFLYEKDDFASLFVGGRHLWQDDEIFLTAAFKRLGAKIKTWEDGGTKAAANALTEALSEGRPAIAWVDAGLLPHRAVPESMQGGGYHVVSVLGLADGGKTVVVGDLADEPINVSAEVFAAARARIKKFKNRLMTVAKPRQGVDVGAAAEGALNACHAVLAGKGAIGAKKNFSLGALAEWADQLTGTGKKSWQHIFPPGKRMWTALTMLYEFVELHGAGGGLCRPLLLPTISRALASACGAPTSLSSGRATPMRAGRGAISPLPPSPQMSRFWGRRGIA